MIRKSGNRFSEKIMLKQKARAGYRSNHNSSRSRRLIAAFKSDQIEAVAGDFGLRCKSESRKQPSRGFPPFSGTSRISPRPTYDIFLHRILPLFAKTVKVRADADIQRIDLDNLGD